MASPKKETTRAEFEHFPRWCYYCLVVDVKVRVTRGSVLVTADTRLVAGRHL